jgi:hypothetical protein
LVKKAKIKPKKTLKMLISQALPLEKGENGRPTARILSSAKKNIFALKKAQN